MSGSGGGKFNPKNLHYDRSATLPPFLARLHAQHAPRGGGDGPDPILAARRRPTKRPRSGSEEAEDAPLVLDEQGNVVDTVSVGRDGTVTERSGSRVEGEGEGDNNTGEEGDRNKEGSKEGNNKRTVPEERGVGIGASKRKKRKVGKVIAGDAGDDDSDQEQEQEQDGDDRKSSVGKAKDKNGGNPEKAGEKPKPNKTTTKKKTTTAKKIKLSFGDGDEEG